MIYCKNVMNVTLFFIKLGDVSSPKQQTQKLGPYQPKKEKEKKSPEESIIE